MKKTLKMKDIESSRHQSIEDMLRRYYAEGFTDRQIAHELHITVTTLYYWLDLLGADVRRSRTVRFDRELTHA